MEYLSKEDVVLRHASKYAKQVEAYYSEHGWLPYCQLNDPELRFVRVLTPQEARDEMVVNGRSAADARKAIPEG